MDAQERSTRAAAMLGAAEHGPRRSTLSADLVEHLQRRIVRGEMAPGERLPAEGEIAAAFGVSRSVVRDAMRMLAARGLVDVRQGSGTVVTLPDDSAFSDALVALLLRSPLTVDDLLDARLAVEGQTAALAAERGTEEDWSRMEAHLRRFREAVTSNERHAAVSAHVAVHQAILEAAHMPALELLLRPLQDFVLVTSAPADPADAEGWDVEGHALLLAAVRSGDPETARAAMAAHLERAVAVYSPEIRARPLRDVVDADGLQDPVDRHQAAP